MAVAQDAVSTSSTEHSFGSSPGDNTKLTIGSGSNRALIVFVILGDASTCSAVTWDQGGTNQSLTRIQTASNTRGAEIWGLVAPTSGNKTLRVAYGGGNGIIVYAISFTGVDQTGGATTFPNSVAATGSSSTPSTGSITSAAGNFTVGCFGAATGSATPTQTALFFTSGSGAQDGGASKATSGTATHSWTIGGSTVWAAVGTDIQASGAATKAPPFGKLYTPQFYPPRRRFV